MSGPNLLEVVKATRKNTNPQTHISILHIDLNVINYVLIKLIERGRYILMTDK